MAKKAKQSRKNDPASTKYLEAIKIVSEHPLFAPLMHTSFIYRTDLCPYPQDGYAIVSDGEIYVHPTRHAEVEEWVYVLSHCLLHLGLGHSKIKHRQDLWDIACDIVVAKFLADFKLGCAPRSENVYALQGLNVNTEEELYQQLLRGRIDKRLFGFGVGNHGESDMLVGRDEEFLDEINKECTEAFGIGLRDAVSSAVYAAGGEESKLVAKSKSSSVAQRARNWFMSSYPLLGALASGFEIIEDQALCRRLDISVAAVNAELNEIYINPGMSLTEEESRFVIAHELLHAGLRHDTRRQGRDHFLWNVACDYVINGWLVEMQLGEMPALGSLYDPALKGESAESVYDTMTSDLRRIRKLATFRGAGGCDMLEPQVPDWWTLSEGTDLDSFYRSCLMQGLEYHNEQGRGYLPAGLVEEVRALAHPPIPWDVDLAKWFDGHFMPLERVRSYARPSRRQSGSPDIPRPRYVPLLEAVENRTFGVLLDTSGSVDRNLLARALGAIASYSMSRDVSRIRLVFCDAATYDQGYIAPEDLLERVKVRGRGGTILQPGIDLLQQAEDFPKNGPILIITDGGCDNLRIKREHAYLIPGYARLPFPPRGKVFRVQ